MAKKKLLDFKRVGQHTNTSNIKTVAKFVGGGLIGEILPSIFQRITGVNSSGPAGNVISGVTATVLLLALNQKEMAGGVVATKTIKAVVTYGNPLAVSTTGVPIALPSTNDTATIHVPKIPQNVGVSDDYPVGTEMLTLPSGERVPVITRDSNPTVNYDNGDNNSLSEYISETELTEALADRYGNNAVEMLSDLVIDQTMGF